MKYLAIQVLDRSLPFLRKVITCLKKHGDTDNVQASDSMIFTPLKSEEKLFLEEVSETYLIRDQIFTSKGRITEQRQYWRKGKMEGNITEFPLSRWHRMFGRKTTPIKLGTAGSLAKVLTKLAKEE